MLTGSNEKLSELVQRITAEQNPVRLKELVKQLNRLLDERKAPPTLDEKPA